MILDTSPAAIPKELAPWKQEKCFTISCTWYLPLRGFTDRIHAEAEEVGGSTQITGVETGHFFQSRARVRLLWGRWADGAGAVGVSRRTWNGLARSVTARWCRDSAHRRAGGDDVWPIRATCPQEPHHSAKHVNSNVKRRLDHAGDAASCITKKSFSPTIASLRTITELTLRRLSGSSRIICKAHRLPLNLDVGNYRSDGTVS